MKIAIIDYGIGNLASAAQGFLAAGMDPVITCQKGEILSADGVVLPGVGAFPKGMENLKALDLLTVIYETVNKGTPFLGICLGMQLLFEESEEYGISKGLGLLPGCVKKFPLGLKVPHMGWNSLNIKKDNPITDSISADSYVYYVHSFYADKYNSEHVVASTEYGLEFPAIVCFNNIVGMQFHPEKSSQVGIRLLRNFGELVKNAGNSGH